MDKKNPEADLYVNIKKPLELRRNILESSKDVLLTLQKLEHIKSLRKEKSDAIQKLKVQIGEINLLVSKLSQHLPNYNLFIKEERQEFSKKKRSKKGKTKHTTKRRSTKKSKKTASINESLNRVQSKLRRLKK